MTESFTLDADPATGTEEAEALPTKAGSLHLWLIEPSAAPDDTRWQDRAIWARVLVAAPSPSFARLVAEEWARPDPAPQIGNESRVLQVGFTDEKLYRVRRAPDAQAVGLPASDWPGRVLDAELLRGSPELP